MFPRLVPALLCSIACGVALAQPRFVPLGDLPGGHFSSWASGVSQDGRVVVGGGKRTTGLSEQEAFAWGEGVGMIGLGDLAGGINGSFAAKISRDYSTIIGSASSAAGYEAAYWSAEDLTIHSIGDLPGGRHITHAYSVSDDGGVIVGEAQGTKGQRAFMWRRDTGVMQDLGTLPNSLPVESAIANCVSGDGRVVIGTSSSGEGGKEAFVWTAETGMVGLGRDPTAKYSTAKSMTPDSKFIVGTRSIWKTGGPITLAYRWTAESGMVFIEDDVDSFDVASPIAISLDGRTIVGNTVPQSDGDETFIWREGVGMVGLESYLKSIGLDVRAMGYRLHFVSNMSDDGRFIVGQATNPDGYGEAFLIEIPAPGVIPPLVLGVLAFARRRR
ncbi:MAG: hypothetical protein JNL50_07470 [Phycisphaerae bacterium]|nr:hypothetical protein [Phycisphaerae bacterium]